MNAYVEIEVVNGPKFRRCDVYTVPFENFGSMVSNYMDGNTEATLKFTIRHLTGEQFERLCEGDDE